MTVTHVIHTIQISVRASYAAFGSGVWGLGSQFTISPPFQNTRVFLKFKLFGIVD